MSAKKTKEEIDQLLKLFNENRFDNHDEAMAILKQVAEADPEDNSLMSYAYYYMAEVSAVFSRNEEAEKYAKICLKYCEKIEKNAYYLAAVCLLGTIACGRSDEPMAAEYLYTALEDTETMKKRELGSKYCVFFYLGDLYASIESYEAAKEYYEEARREFISYYGEGRHPESYASIPYGIANCNLGLKNLEELNKNIQELDALNTDDKLCSYRHILIFLRGYSYFLAGKKAEAVEQMCNYLDTLTDETSTADMYGVLKYIFEVFEAEGNNDRMLQVIGILEQKVSEEQEKNNLLLLELARMKIKYYEALSDKDMLLQSYREYYKAQQEYYGNSLAQRRANLELRKKMFEEIKIKRGELKESVEKSRTDQLTGTANRMGLESYSQNLVKKHFKEKTSIGALILDIDRYKQYNDSLGHLAGDDCLEKLGKLFNEIKGDVFCCRYGGDEFLFVLEGKNEDEAFAFAEKVSESVRGLNIPHPANQGGIVTISQGLYVSVPEDEFGDFKDYIYLADQALYNCKKANRGGISVYGRS